MEATHESDGLEPSPEFVYVRERNLLKILLGGLVAIVFATTFLFAVGFAMSFVGFRPPTFDARILEDQWAKRVQDAPKSYEDCVEKGGTISDLPSSQCTLDGTVFGEPEA